MSGEMHEEDCDCEAAKAGLDAFRRGELSAAEVRTLGAHLEHCRHCHCLQQFEAAFLERLRHAGQTGCCPDELRRRVGEMLASAQPDA